MKRLLATILTLSMFFVAISFSGCSNSEKPDPDKYSDYVCYDYHLACLDAHEGKSEAKAFYNDTSYTVWYRKPVGITDEQFVCAWVKGVHPLSTPFLAIMQNPDNYVDVFQEWTVKQIEIYYVDINRSSHIWEENEPARTPIKTLTTVTDELFISEMINFITDEDYNGKFEAPEGYYRESYNTEESYKLYLRIKFNESENIVWDSEIKSFVSEKDQNRYILIDKGRTTAFDEGSQYVVINSLDNLTKTISDTIDALITD